MGAGNDPMQSQDRKMGAFNRPIGSANLHCTVLYREGRKINCWLKSRPMALLNFSSIAMLSFGSLKKRLDAYL
jgi:hypothetical protein